MQTLLNFAHAVGGFLTVMICWFAFQNFIRRRSGCGSNKDVLDFMKNGCAGCKGNGACHNREKEK